MQITRQADYAARAILYLARTGNGKRISTNQVAKDQNIPPSFLAKIISQLSIAGLLQTARGASGGVALARKPENITLLDVIQAIDGPIQLNDCVVQEDVCCFQENCSMQLVWSEAQNDLITRLKSTTFAKLIA